MATGSHSPRTQKPAEIAAEAKRNYIPYIKKECKDIWSIDSFLYHTPLEQLGFSEQVSDLLPPVFEVYVGNPVDTTIETRRMGYNAGFICPANERKAGGEWETAVEGVEERLCRRSTLSANLGYDKSNYPIPISGGIFSRDVVVFRGSNNNNNANLHFHDWVNLPVCSMPPQRWPKLTQNGTKYSFGPERLMAENKMRGAARICLFHGLDHLVIGDWGLGKGCRNPPLELAELWREIFLYDPELRGRVRKVTFVFENERQSTTAIIREEQERQSHKHHSKGGSSSSSKGKSKGKSKSSGSNNSHSTEPAKYEKDAPPTDVEIFQRVFHLEEINRFIHARDARCEIDMLTG